MQGGMSALAPSSPSLDVRRPNLDALIHHPKHALQAKCRLMGSRLDGSSFAATVVSSAVNDREKCS